MLPAPKPNWIKLCRAEVIVGGSASQETIQEKIFEVFRASVEPGRFVVRDSQWDAKTFVTNKYTKCPTSCPKMWRVRILISDFKELKIPFDIEVTDGHCLHKFDPAIDIPRPVKLKGIVLN